MREPFNGSRWFRPLKPIRFKERAVFDLVLGGGQAFRWVCDESGVWAGIWGNVAVQFRLDEAGQLEYCLPTGSCPDVHEKVADYFPSDEEVQRCLDALPWRSDRILAAAIRRFDGLRLLRQPLEETLLCYLCSSTKQIDQIRVCCHAIAERLGRPIAEGLNRLPQWEELAKVGEPAIRACGVGYRAKWIHQTALFLAERPDYLAAIPELDVMDAREHLAKLPGVGFKIADCTLLYSGTHPNAFPTDRWILRAMERLYGLGRWSAEQIAHFGRIHFGPHAGLAQQYLFEAVRLGWE